METTYKQINEWLDKTFSANGKKLFLLILSILLVGLICFAVLSVFGKKNASAPVQDDMSSEYVNSEETIEVQDDDDALIDIEVLDNNYVSMDLENTGRTDPFLPASDAVITTRSTSYKGFSLMAPPENLYEQSDAAKVVTTRVSGILYDESSPSAILNMEGADYLVKSGDYIKNYKILAINKDVVTVQLGKNIYKAGVGQIINNETPVNYNSVYNLQNRFGGAKK